MPLLNRLPSSSWVHPVAIVPLVAVALLAWIFPALSASAQLEF